MSIYEKIYWSSQTDEQLRKTMFDTGLLDTERGLAKKELTKRTTQSTINDLQGRFD
jgi:hypothetical protein